MKHWLEYAVLRGCQIILNLIPYFLAAFAARAFAWFVVVVLRFKGNRTRTRIRSVFPGLPDREVRKIAVRSLQNIFLTGVEMMRSYKLDRAWMDRHVVDGEKYAAVVRGLLAEGRGVVIMVPHSGNWYMAAWAMARYGLPLFAIAARQRNRYLDRWMNRQYADIEVLDRDNRDTLVKIKEYLQAGRAFAILPDLRVRHRDTEVDFFGAKANVSHAGAAFAVNNGCPIVVAQMVRDGSKHVINYLATLRPDSDADRKTEARRLTREAMKLLDEAVRKHPGDWFWYNKRWILEPPEK